MIFKGIGATTHIDRHQMKMTKEALDSAANQVNNSGSVPAIGLNHDLTIMPLGKVIEAKVTPTEDGEYKLEILQELFEKEYTIKFETGEVFYMSKSSTDNSPFTENTLDTSKVGLAYDMVNFESMEKLDEFLNDVDDNINQEIICRKQLIPDPELIITISKSILVYLAGKKVLDKAADKLIENALTDVNNFYTFVRNIMIKYAKYAIPKNRPITYVFKCSPSYILELIAQTSDVSLVMTSIGENKIKEVFSNLKDIENKFSIKRIQYILNENGIWEFNYLLTNKGEVIGTEKSYSRRAKAFELFQKGIDENPS